MISEFFNMNIKDFRKRLARETDFAMRIYWQDQLDTIIENRNNYKKGMKPKLKNVILTNKIIEV